MKALGTAASGTNIRVSTESPPAHLHSVLASETDEAPLLYAFQKGIVLASGLSSIEQKHRRVEQIHRNKR